MILLDELKISLDVDSILKGQGVQPEKADSALIADAQNILEEAENLISPLALFSIFKVKNYNQEMVELEDGGFFQGKLATRILAGSTEIALGVCTIGSDLENLGEKLFYEDPVKAMALIGAGIAALRLTSEAMLAEIRKIAASKSLGSGMRAQPGQEGWPIEQQKIIFDRLPAEKIGVYLNNSYLMIPKKSVSSVVGIGPDMRPDGIACDYCSKKKNCPWRIKD